MNKFIGYNRGFSQDLYMAPEFFFKDHHELLSNSHIQAIGGKTPTLKMLRQKRAWLGTQGRVSREFFTVVLETNNGNNWVVIGRCVEDVPEFKEWDK